MPGMKYNLARAVAGWMAAMLLVGCRATQPVVWEYHAPLVPERGASVAVRSTCPVPADQLAFLQQDVQHYVSRVLKGRTDDPSAYRVEVVITRYDEGNMALRLLTFGLTGRIYLEGTVEVREAKATDTLGRAWFEKWYGALMPVANLFASMERTVTPKVGLAVARALEKSVEKGRE